jgi:hypothetical protein
VVREMVEHELSSDLLRRIVAAGGSVRITLYAPDSDGSDNGF